MISLEADSICPMLKWGLMCSVNTAVLFFLDKMAQNDNFIVSIDQPKQLWQPVNSDHMLMFLYHVHLYGGDSSAISLEYAENLHCCQHHGP